MRFLMLLAIVLTTGCGTPREPEATPMPPRCATGDTVACARWVRAHLRAPASEAEAERFVAQLDSLAAGHRSQETEAAHAAGIVRLAKYAAQREDVVKAVELIDSGLARFSQALERTPGSRVVRLYRINTIAQLPTDLLMGPEVLDSIQSFRRSFDETAEEDALLRASQQRVEEGVGSP